MTGVGERVGALWKRTVAAVESKVDIDKALGKTRKVLEVGSEAADVLVQLGGGLTLPGGAALAMRIAHTAAGLRARGPEEYFSAGWKKFFPEELETLLWRGLRAIPGTTVEEIGGLHQDTPGVLIHLDGAVFGWALNGPFKSPECTPCGCWLPYSIEKPEALLSRVAWASAGGERAIVRTDKKTGELIIVPEPETTLFSSQRGDEMYARVLDFRKRGHNRSVFAVGPPGVGKSCMLRYVASKMGGYCLRIKLSQMKDMDPEALVDLVRLLRPNVLIIDDFDRLVQQDDFSKMHTRDAELLDPLEEINDLVPLFMVSANYSTEITEALLRPGRFDEIEEIEEVDPELYEQLLPDAPAKIINALKTQKAPVSHVLELKKRVDSLGYVAAAKELEELMSRADVVIKKSRRKANPKKQRATLVGKTDRQKARLLDKRAAKADRAAERAAEFVFKEQLKAEENREKAAKARASADAKVKAEAEKRAAAKKSKKPRKQTGADATLEEAAKEGEKMRGSQ